MIYLLDVNLLLACAWSSHSEYSSANRWLNAGNEFATAPIIQMGFLRVSMSSGYGASFQDAIASLGAIVKLKSHRFVIDAIPAAILPAVSGKDVTDAHLIKLASSHGFKLATLDEALLKKAWATGIAENPL